MRPIDADELLKSAGVLDAPPSGSGLRTFLGVAKDWLRGAVEKAPTIDAVPVVRCKACANWTVDGAGKPWCHGWSTYQSEGDAFCSYGVRKDGA